MQLFAPFPDRTNFFAVSDRRPVLLYNYNYTLSMNTNCNFSKRRSFTFSLKSETSLFLLPLNLQHQTISRIFQCYQKVNCDCIVCQNFWNPYRVRGQGVLAFTNSQKNVPAVLYKVSQDNLLKIQFFPL